MALSISGSSPSFTTYQGGVVTSGTAVASTSGTSIDFTSIPSWVKRVTVMFRGVQTSGTSPKLIQIGSGSVTTSGYVSTGSYVAGAVSTTSSTSGYVINSQSASDIVNTVATIVLISGNTWVCSYTGKQATGTSNLGSGDVALSGTLDRVRITTANGTDTFTAGTINILYE
jgi:hypothetical protein